MPIILLIIKVERSGGIAGLSAMTEVDTKDLPSALANKVKKIIEQKKSPKLPNALPRGAADHYSYRISILDEGNKTLLESNQYDIQNELKTLLKYIEKNSSFK
jgi:hypothetical protein